MHKISFICCYNNSNQAEISTTFIKYCYSLVNKGRDIITNYEIDLDD